MKRLSLFFLCQVCYHLYHWGPDADLTSLIFRGHDFSFPAVIDIQSTILIKRGSVMIGNDRLSWKLCFACLKRQVLLDCSLTKPCNMNLPTFIGLTFRVATGFVLPRLVSPKQQREAIALPISADIDRLHKKEIASAWLSSTTSSTPSASISF